MTGKARFQTSLGWFLFFSSLPGGEERWGGAPSLEAYKHHITPEKWAKRACCAVLTRALCGRV